MFVFKAAVVGAGTMGGEIAQVISSAGIPVVLKDVKQEFVDQGLAKAREVTQAQLAGLVAKEKISQEDADRQLEEVVGRIARHARLRRLRRRGLRDRGRARADGDQAGGLRRARRGHARPRDPGLEHVLALDHRDGRGDDPAGQGLRLPLLLPRVDDAPDRGDRGRGVVGRDDPGRRQLRAADPQDGGPLRRGARLRGQPHPQLGRVGGVARDRGGGPRRRGGRQGHQGVGHRPDGPVLPHRPARARHGPARRRAPARVVRRPVLRVARR